jgi:hypothetical protein
LPVAVNGSEPGPDTPSVSRRRDRRVGEIGRDPARGRDLGDDVTDEEFSRRWRAASSWIRVSTASLKRYRNY